jgi:hypothetical protein
MTEIRFSMLENALHSLERSLRHAGDAENYIREWKFGILLLIQAIELVFKELLFRSHPVLIYKDIDTRKNTVSFMIALKRLQNICGVNLSDNDIRAIKTAVNWRNQLMHYEFSVNSLHAHSVYYKLIAFLMEFYEKIFDRPLRNDLSDDVWNQVLQIEAFIKDAMDRIKDRINDKNIESSLVWQCSNCGQDAFVVQDGENICYLCGYTDDVICCEDCGDIDYIDMMHEIQQGNFKGLEFTKLICDKCYDEKYSSYGEDYWE